MPPHLICTFAPHQHHCIQLFNKEQSAPGAGVVHHRHYCRTWARPGGLWTLKSLSGSHYKPLLTELRDSLLPELLFWKQLSQSAEEAVHEDSRLWIMTVWSYAALLHQGAEGKLLYVNSYKSSHLWLLPDHSSTPELLMQPSGHPI